MTASEPRGAGSLKVERSGGGSETILPMNAIVAIHLDGEVTELSIVINHPGSKFPDHVRQNPVMQLLFLLVLSIPSVPFVVVL
jgi:hypothetical protein